MNNHKVIDVIKTELCDMLEIKYPIIQAGDEEKGLAAAGECAQRVNDVPTVKDLVERIMKEAEEIIRDFPKNFIVQ
jgi:hypothetical protein